MRVSLRLKMPRESILKGEGEYDPDTGEVVFCAHTATETDRRLRRSVSGSLQTLEAVAVIEGKELPLTYKDDRWFAHKYDFRGKLQPLRWQVPPPAPRWESPLFLNNPDRPKETVKKRRPVIRFIGILKIWNMLK